jgi:hypothetical protein
MNRHSDTSHSISKDKNDESQHTSNNNKVSMKPFNMIETLASTINQLSLSTSSIILSCAKVVENDDKETLLKKNSSCTHIALVIDSSEIDNNKSKSLNLLGDNNEENKENRDTENDKQNEKNASGFKLQSPYGDWCAFE